jgi:hypothetical protein
MVSDSGSDSMAVGSRRRWKPCVSVVGHRRPLTRQWVRRFATVASWRDIGRALGTVEGAENEQDVIDPFSDQERELWRRFWT